MSLANKSALVTGGTGAIGAAICVKFLENGVKHLAALDLSSEEPKVVCEWRQKFPEATIKYFCVDVSSAEKLQKCFAEFIKEVKNLNIVVNCAGFLNETTYRKIIEVNLCGVIESTRLAVEHMRVDRGNGKGGIILTISSDTGVRPVSCLPTYSASKHASIAYCRAMAHDRDYMGINFLALCPAGTQSPMYNQAKHLEYLYEITEEKQELLMKGFPPQSPEEVGKAAIKIMQDGKSGSVWTINSGELTEENLTKIVF